MEFGTQFFPDVGPDVKSAQAYWSEALHLTSLVDELGFTNVRTVATARARFANRFSTSSLVKSSSK